MSVGLRFFTSLQQKGVKTKDITSKFNISQQYISSLKKSEKINDTMASIADYYGININWLIAGEGEMFVAKNNQVHHITLESVSNGSAVIENSSNKTQHIQNAPANTLNFPNHVIDDLNSLFARVKDEQQKDKLLEELDEFIHTQKKKLR